MMRSLASFTFRPSCGFTLVPRWIGDGFSWTMHLPTEGVTPPLPANEHSVALTRDPCIATDWALSELDEPDIYFQVVTNPSFWNTYLTAGMCGGPATTVRIPIEDGTHAKQPSVASTRGARIVTDQRSKIRYYVVEKQDIGTAFRRIAANPRPRVPIEERRL